MIWSPAGPTVEVTTSSSVWPILSASIQFNPVYLINNADSAVGFISFVTVGATIGEGTQRVPILPASFLFVQIGAPLTAVVVSSASLKVSPGYAMK